MEKQYCKKCEAMVVWKKPPTVTMNGKIFYLGCPGKNDLHFCERKGISIHDELACKCLEDK